MTGALKHRSGVKNVALNLDKAQFLVEGNEGTQLNMEDLKQTIEEWEDFNYRVGDVEVLL